MVKRLFRGRKISIPRFKGLNSRLSQVYLKLDYPAKWLDTVVTMTLKLGTLVLVLFLILLISQIFKKQGYVIEPFSVPESFEKNGFNGAVIAGKIQDEVLAIKGIARSIKADSTKLIGNDDLEFDLSVMGVGVSLNSMVYHIRRIFGRKNEVIQGEITQIDSTFSLTLRMTGFPAKTQEVIIVDGHKKEAIEELLRKGGELILSNQDPYRVAIYCYRKQRYDEAVNLVRQIIRERPQEVHWAYLAWGSILEAQSQHEEAIRKFRRAIELKPDFETAYARLSWALSREGDSEGAVAMMRKAVETSPPSTQLERLINLGWQLNHMRNYAGADSAFQRATELEPRNLDTWSSWANSKIQSERSEEALPLIENIEALAEENANGYLARALCSFVRQDTIGAYEHLETALDFDPTLLYAIEANVFVHWENRNYAKVIRIYEKSDLSRINMYKQQQIMNAAAMAYNYLGLHEKAFQTVREAIAVNPGVGFPYSTLAEIYAFTGDMEQFYTQLEKAFQLGMRPSSIEFVLEPYASMKNDSRLLEIMDRYGRLKG